MGKFFSNLFFYCFLLLFGGVSISAQQGANPFEIRSRLDSVSRIISLSPSLPNSAIVADSDSLQYTSKQNDSINSNISEAFAIDKKALQNPFDVDHVPERKPKFTKTAENKNLIEGIKHTSSGSNSFLFWVLLLGTSLLAIVINIRFSAITFVFKSIFNFNVLKLFQREESKRISPYLIILYILFLINISTSTYLITTYFGIPKGIQYLLLLIGGFIVIYSIRHISLAVLGALFKIERTTSLYSFVIMIYNLLFGIILIPLNFLLAFGPTGFIGILVYIAISLGVIIVLMRTIRALFISMEFVGDRFFQLILYLCAFEIAPMWILVKFLMYQVNN